MRMQVLLILLVLAVCCFTLEGCNRSSSSSNSPPTGGEDPGEPPGGEPPEEDAAIIVLEEDDLVLSDPESGNDGVAAPGETITYTLTIKNTGESQGRIEIQDLKVQPSSSLEITSRLVDGVPVSDFTQVEVPAQGSVLVGGTAKVDPSITDPLVIAMGPPVIVASSPPTEPETYVDPEEIKGFDTMAVDEEEEPPPPPPPSEGGYHVRRPGSLLVFPFYQVLGQPGQTLRDTLITVTNINPDVKVESDGLPAGTIDVMFSYQDAQDCWPFQIWERLTPNDTLSLMVGDHIPFLNFSQGWLYIVAQDPVTGEPVDFDHLIGHATFFDAGNANWFQYNPIAYRALPGDGLPTDLDFDGNIDLNGEEYEQVGDNQMFPRFIGTLPAGGGKEGYSASLLLLNLSGGALFESQVDLLVYNDNEQAFSTMHLYHCWEFIPLADIETLFTNSWLLSTNHDPDEELAILGHDHVETGWFEVDGNSAWSPVKMINDPAFMCFMVEYYGNRVVFSKPFDNGVKQDNATLWSLSALGDNED